MGGPESGCISPLYPVGRGWRMGRHGRDQSLSYLLAELESSRSAKDFSCQWIPWQNLRAEAERLHLLYPAVWDGEGKTRPRSSSNPQRISKKWAVRNQGASLLYTLWVGDGEWEDMAETNPYRICWRSWRVADPQRIFPASGFLGKTYALRLSGCISYTLRSGMEKGRHDRDRVAIRKGFRKNGRSGIRVHLSSIPCGSGMENGKTWPRPIPIVFVGGAGE